MINIMYTYYMQNLASQSFTGIGNEELQAVTGTVKYMQQCCHVYMEQEGASALSLHCQQDRTNCVGTVVMYKKKWCSKGDCSISWITVP